MELDKFKVNLISMLIHEIVRILGKTSHVIATMCQDTTSEAVQCITASTISIPMCACTNSKPTWQIGMRNADSLVDGLLKVHHKEQQDLCKLMNRTHYALPQCGKLKGTKLVC